MGICEKLGDDYDRMIDWPARLRRDLPVVRQLLDDSEARTVLDAGCATGVYTLALAEIGYTIVGLDPSSSMLAVAEANIGTVPARFVTGFLSEADQKAGTNFDAALVLGNTLSYILKEKELSASLTALYRALLPGGLLCLQIRNIEAQGGQEVILPGKDLGNDRSIERTLTPIEGGLYELKLWRVTSDVTEEIGIETLRGWTSDQLTNGLREAGFSTIEVLGNLKGDLFMPMASTDIVMRAIK